MQTDGFYVLGLLLKRKKNSYKNVNIIDELRLPQSSLLLWHNWVIIETLKIPTKISNSSCASTHWNLKNLSKTNFFSPNSQLPNHYKILPCQTTIICIYVFFPHGVELDYFSPSKKSSQHYTWPDSGTYNEASGNVVQQGHISIPSLSVVKEFFQLFFPQLLSSGK